jgi:hypothetical protein
MRSKPAFGPSCVAGFPVRGYLDTFVKMDSAWLFAERRLYVDWLEERTLS